MLNVTTAFNEAFKSDLREVKMRIKINDVTYTDEDIVSFNYNAGSIVGESFAIGSTFANTIKLTLCKVVEGLKQLDEVIPEMGIVLPNGSIEWVKLGTFIISEEVNPDRNENRTSIECTDKMIMLDDIYESKLKYPARIRAVALEIANLAGVEVDLVSFGRLMENTIQKPVGYTYRQALGLIAQFEAGYVCFDRNGLLAIKQLEDKDYQVTPNEYFLKGLIKNELMFKPAGIQVKVSSDTEEDKVLKIGNEKGSVIHLENKVMTDGLLRLVYDKVKNINYYPYTLKWRGNPAVEVGDWLQVTDTKGNLFKVPNLSYSFEYKGGLTATSTVETVASNEVRFGYKGILDQTVEYVENALKDVGGNLIYYGVEAPPNPKEGDTWFKYVDSDTEIWVYEKIAEPDVFDWVFKISSAVDNSIKEKIDELEQQSKDQQINIDKALSDAEKAREEAEVARQEAFDSSTIAKQAEKDALDALLKGDQNSTQITTLEGQQKLTNTKVEGNTANILNLQTDSEKLSLSIGKVQADVENLDLSSRNLLQNTTDFNPLPPTNAIDTGYSLSKVGDKLRVAVSNYVEGNAIKFKLTQNVEPNSFITIRFTAYPWTMATKFRFKMSYSSYTEWQSFPVSANTFDYSITFKVGEIVPNNWLWLETSNTFEILEKSFIISVSNKKVGWQPAPEDMTTKTEFATFEATVKGFQQTVNSDISGLQSQQTQMAGQITRVVEKVDNLEIEGRNLYSLLKLNMLNIENWIVPAYLYKFVLEPNTEYTLSSNVPSYANDTSKTNIYFNGSNSISDGVWLNKNVTKKSDTDGNLFVAIPANRIHTEDLRKGIYWIKLEKGIKFTGFTTAPEDNASKSEVIQLSDQITQTVNKVETLDGKVTSQQSQITQLSNNISLKVDEDNVIAQINLSPEQVLIQAKRIHLSGESLIDNAVIKSAHIQDGSITNVKIQDATIDSAKINSIDASKINAQTLQSITSNTGQLNVTGWLDFQTENRGLRGSYDFGDPYNNAYNFRWFDGDFRLSHRHLVYGGNVHSVNSDNTKGKKVGRAESYYGLDYTKHRYWDSNEVMQGRMDLTATYLSMSTSHNDSVNVMISSDGAAYFNNTVTATKDIVMRANYSLFTYNIQSLTTGANIYFNYSRKDLADFRIGRDGSTINGGRLIQSEAVYNRTYSGVANVTVTSEGTIGRITSAKKYKTDIRVADDVVANAKKVLQIKPAHWLDKGEVSDGKVKQRYYGFIADEFDLLGLKQVVIYNERKEVESLAYDRISMYHNVILSEHEDRIKRLERMLIGK